MSYKFTDPRLESIMTSNSRRAKAQLYIQEQLQKYECITRYYRSRHNALSASCRIPPEILVAIFEEVLEIGGELEEVDTPDAADSDSFQRCRLHRIKAVTHVCSHWRNVALSSPNLWAGVNPNSRQWAHAMIQRSKTAPLSIVFRYSDWTGSYASTPILQDILKNRLSGVKILILDYRESRAYVDGSRELLALLDQAAPVMEQLEIHSHKLVGVEGDSNFELPDGLIGSLARLRKLDLTGCGMAWEFASFRNLRCLNILDLPPAVRPSIKQLLGVLSQTPLLETLYIRYSLLDVESTPRRNVKTTRVELPSLQDIKVVSSLSTSAFLFDHLILPKNICSITVNFDRIVGWEDPGQSAISTLKQMLWHFVDVVDGDIATLILSGRIQAARFTPSTPNWQPTINVGDLMNTTHFMTSKFQATFWQSFCSNKLGTLSIHDHSLPLSTWSFLGRLPMLETLSVDDTNTILLLSALILSGSCLPFPSLRKFCIIGWNFDNLVDCELAEGTLVALMETCFKLRKEAGLHLKQLELHRCQGMSPRQVDALKSIINAVDYFDL